MTYYEHATAMAFKLERWGEQRPLRNYEREALACEQIALESVEEKQSIYTRCLFVLRTRQSLVEGNGSIPVKS